MLSRLIGRRPADARASTSLELADGFRLFSAVLDGQKVCAFVAPQGTAAAVEMGEERAMVLTGLAAGIILSDIEEAAASPASGLGAVASRIDRLSADDADALIGDLTVLTDGQKDQLRTALSL